MATSLSSALRKTIGTAGWLSRMRPATSAPLPSGRCESITTTSGCCSMAWRTASAAVAAVATTLRSPVALIMAANPSDTSRWSSTSKTVMGARSGDTRKLLPVIGDPVLDHAAVAGGGCDAKPPTRHLCTFAHGDQSKMAGYRAIAAAVEPHAVVRDPGQDAVIHR